MILRPKSLGLDWWGGMHPVMEPNFSKWRLIFRPKSLLLGWWGGMHPPIPPLNPPLHVSINFLKLFLTLQILACYSICDCFIGFSIVFIHFIVKYGATEECNYYECSRPLFRLDQLWRVSNVTGSENSNHWPICKQNTKGSLLVEQLTSRTQMRLQNRDARKVPHHFPVGRLILTADLVLYSFQIAILSF